jgi:hypothetical protein
VKSTKNYYGKQGVGRYAKAKRETVAIHTHVNKRVMLSWMAARLLWEKRNDVKHDTNASMLQMVITRALRANTKFWQDEDRLARKAARK